jgi:hypothetical protein
MMIRRHRNPMSPWVYEGEGPRPETKVIHIGSDPIFERPIRCAAYQWRSGDHGRGWCDLDALNRALAAREKIASARMDAGASGSRSAREKMLARARRPSRKTEERLAHSSAWINHCIARVKGDDGIVVKDALTPAEHLHFEKPGTYFSMGRAVRSAGGSARTRFEGRGARQAVI